MKILVKEDVSIYFRLDKSLKTAPSDDAFPKRSGRIEGVGDSYRTIQKINNRAAKIQDCSLLRTIAVSATVF
ncbi:hypothetical protein [Methanimicrococcus hongohii]|uniref:hypothetical protein n=1 Tax=Methanimicrococcus hongohii TaxID=3028295 RepID=UPI0029309D7D|nr:hypothetical protein [Methanimicrococcus sp. Hf6]